MAALAYLFLPLSGMTAYFVGGSPRVRFHGLQAVVLGLVWPLLLFGCSALSPLATQVAFVLGGILWLFLVVTTAAGRDPRLPLVGTRCARVADLTSNESG